MATTYIAKFVTQKGYYLINCFIILFGTTPITFGQLVLFDQLSGGLLGLHVNFMILYFVINYLLQSN